MRTAGLILVLAAVSCQAAWRFTRCPADCLCSLRAAPELGDALLRTVDCSSRGLRAFPAPEHLPSDAQVLRLDGNRLRRLHHDRLWLPDLLHLDLAANRLPSLPRPSRDGLGSFEGLAALRSLNLAGNKLRRVGSDAFTGLVALTSLDLSNNRIDGVMDNAFEGLRQLENLNLSGNRLSYVQKSWWSAFPSLLSVDLSGNSIALLQNDAFRSLAHLRTLDLSDNKIFRVAEHAFFGLARLGSLNIAGNALTAFPKGPVSHLRKSLKSLDASRNPLFRITMEDLANFDQLATIKLTNMKRLRLVERGALKNLPSLIQLELHDAPFLAYVDPTAFVNVPALSHLFLHNNALTVLEPATIHALPALQELSFYGNPLACDCNARWLRLHLDSDRVVIREADRLLCSSPEQHRLKRLAMLPTDALPLQCPPRIVRLFDDETERKLGEDIVLDCRAVGVPAPALSWLAPDGSIIRPGDFHPRRLLRNGNTLVLRHLQFEDAGRYTCIVKSLQGQAHAVAQLRVSSIQVEIVPLTTGTDSATVTWRGLDRSANVFQIMYRPANTGSLTRHRYGGSVSPAMRSATLSGLLPDTEYEICLAFEDGRGVLTHISCAFMTTRVAATSLPATLLSRPALIGLAALAVAALAALLCLIMALLARRGGPRPAFAYDNLASLGSPDLPRPPAFLKPKLPAFPRLETSVSVPGSTENVYSPLVTGNIV